VRTLVLGLSVLLVACGGSAPVGPTAPIAPPPLVIRDGWSEQPVAAEAIPQNPTMGQRLTVRAAGFLPREQMFDGAPVLLWPQREDYVQAVVYRPTSVGLLSRWEGGFALTASADLLSDPDVRSVMEQAASEASRVAGIPVTVASAGQVSVSIDPSDPVFSDQTVAAAAYSTLRGSTVTGARLIFRHREAITGGSLNKPNTLLHELGHALGLGHSPELSDVMAATRARTDARAFGPSESIALRLMYRWRRPGNAFPDRAPELAGLSTQTRTIVIVD
jgi:hypothetical protein